MRIIVAIIAISFLCNIFSAAQSNSNMITKSFHVLPSIEEARHSGGAIEMQEYKPRDEEEIWKESFSEMGVKWPKGSSIRYLPALAQMIVYNTPNNIKKFGQIVSIKYIVAQIEVQVLIISFDLKDIELLLQKTTANQATLLTLWKDGKGKLISAPRIVTQSGAEAQVDDTTINAPLIKVLPEVSPEGQMIHITLTTPYLTTSVSLTNGAVLLAGGGTLAPNGKHIIYTFLTARLLDIEGNRINIDG